MSKTSFLISLLLMVPMVASFGGSVKEQVRLFDFRGDARGWTGNRDVTRFRATPAGISFVAGEFDPWIEGPASPAMPLGGRVRLQVRIKSSKSGTAQIFYGPRFSAEAIAEMEVRGDNHWSVAEAILPPQEEGTRLRIDPPGGAICTVAWIDAQALPSVEPFRPPSPKVQAFPANGFFTIQSGNLSLQQDPLQWGAFEVRVKGDVMADSHAQEPIGIQTDDGKRYWMDTGAADAICRKPSADKIECSVELTDPDGAKWRCIRRFKALPERNAVEVETEFSVDRDRNVFHLPWVTLFPGLGSFGEKKEQALLPGVEYLENEPSSSEADVEGFEADRRIVDDFRLCYPMMALSNQGRYIALVWNRGDHPAPAFDSPDRLFHSGAHLFGLWEPPVGRLRLEHDINVYETFRLQRNQPRHLRFMLLGGEGDTIVPAIRHYVALRGLPDLPVFRGGFAKAVRLLAAGWLQSQCGRNGLYRHAVWGNDFPPQPAADAAAYMQWLSVHTPSAALADKLTSAAAQALNRLPANTVYAEGVSHVRPPAGSLVFGKLTEYLDRRVASARWQIGGFDSSGVLHYKHPEGKPDYARTHYVDHANGFAAATLQSVLEAAALSGDDDLTSRGLELLDKQSRLYANTVPRGAQTWEMPLHTPDILGSGYLVRCYTLGYLLAGKERYLDQARYWAWTGLAMLYLDSPFDAPVGPYATIGVIGATNWRSPNWIGKPVQWCGLVYRSALLDLAEIDPGEAAFWRKIANGITLSGLQMTFPADDEKRCGLLPDSFALREQRRDGPAINPGTVSAGVPECFGKGRFFSMTRLPDGRIVHAPGAVTAIREEQEGVRFRFEAWPRTPCQILITRQQSAPDSVQWSGDPKGFVSKYDEARRVLIITVQGAGEIVMHDSILGVP